MTDITEAVEANRRLQESLRKFTSVFEISPEAIAVTRARDDVHIEVNGAWSRLIGHPRGSAVGRSALEMGIWIDRADRVRLLEELRHSGRVSNFDARFRRADGAAIDVLLSCEQLELEREPCLVHVWRDVSEQKHRERALAESEERFAKAFLASPDMMTITRLEDGMFYAVNPGFERTTGYTTAEAVGRSISDLGIWAIPGGREDFIALLRRDGVVREHQFAIRTRSGTIVYGRLSATQIELEGVPAVIGIVHDITAQKRVEQRLAESEERFEKAFQSSQEAIGISRLADSRIIAVNHRFALLYGSTEEKIVGRTSLELGLWGGDPGLREQILARLRTEGQICDMMVAVRTAGGETRTCNYSADVIEIGAEPHVIGFLRDITEQRRAALALAASERKYRGLYEAAQDGIAILSPEGIIADVNPALCLATGYPHGELVGRPLTVVLTAADSADLRSTFAQLPEHGTLRLEATGQRRDRSALPVEIRAWWLHDGTIQAIVRDITERKREEELVINIARGVSATTGEAFFHSLVEHLTRALDASHAFIAEFVPPQTSRARTLAFFAEGASAPNFEYALEGSPCANALKVRGTVIYPDDVAGRFPADTGLRRMGVRGYAGTSLFDAGGRALGILVVLWREAITNPQFVTSMLEIFAARAAAELERSRVEARILALNASLEQRVRERTEALQFANRELESFSYSISHDLRAPVRAIGGFASILAARHGATLNDEARRYLDLIDRNARRMGELIEDLLALARASRGALERDPVDMRRLVDGVIEDLGAGDRVAVAELPAVRGDASLLRQVWHNLIANSMKFSRDAAVPRIEVGGKVLADGMVEYSVRDNGCGFDMRHAGKLFEVFQRLHSEQEYEGTGAGLAIVQRIVARHGGRVAAEGSPGRGARFSFVLPA